MKLGKLTLGDPVAVPWYSDKASYDAVFAMLPASETQDPFTYDVFIARIEKMEEQIERTGAATYRIPIKAVTLKGWCDANNLQVCRASIAEFITIALALKLKRGGPKNN